MNANVPAFAHIGKTHFLNLSLVRQCRLDGAGNAYVEWSNGEVSTYGPGETADDIMAAVAVLAEAYYQQLSATIGSAEQKEEEK